MVTSASIKHKRIAAGIVGHVLCKKLSIPRSRLSHIERDYMTVTPEELQRIDAALDDLIRAKAAIQETAIAAGWPVAEVTAQ
jgi:hypothetical protein